MKIKSLLLSLMIMVIIGAVTEICASVAEEGAQDGRAQGKQDALENKTENPKPTKYTEKHERREKAKYKGAYKLYYDIAYVATREALKDLQAEYEKTEREVSNWANRTWLNRLKPDQLKTVYAVYAEVYKEEYKKVDEAKKLSHALDKTRKKLDELTNALELTIE